MTYDSLYKINLSLVSINSSIYMLNRHCSDIPSLSEVAIVNFDKLDFIILRF